MIVFGLTGGIACGKSSVTKTFLAHGIPMVDADLVARQVVAPGTTGLTMIVETFGSSYLLEDGTLNRPALASLVFNDKKAMIDLNHIMAPIIEIESKNQIDLFHYEGHPIVGYDAALIIEQGNAKKYRPLIVVQCPEDTQLARLMSRNSLTREEAMARIAAQMPTAQKIIFADYVVDTSGTIENSIAQTESIILQLRKLL
jgi:dephospho-CoA kinase